MNVIDLFCGCGGFSQGFLQAGFNVILGIDMWEDAINTYRYNFPKAIALNKDITKINGNEILKLTKLSQGEIDVIIGGPPCQGFSVSGKRLIDDARNKLYKSFVEIVSKIKPKVFVMENVPGLVRLFKGQVYDEIIRDFSNIGYKVQMINLFSDNYGVPQRRQRIFFVGLSNKLGSNVEYKYPLPIMGKGTSIPAYTCSDAISDLDFIPDDRILGEEISYVLPAKCEYQRKMRNGSDKLFNHIITLHTAKTKEIIAHVPNGGNYKDLPEELQNTRKVHIAWTRMNSEKPCFTIDTGHNHHFHYRANRVPTVRESARIQSFPDTFKFIGIKTSQAKQVGNAVPPLLGEAIARSIIDILGRG